MGKHFGPVQLIQPVHQLVHVPPHLAVILKEPGFIPFAESFIKTDPFPDIKGMIHMGAGGVELSDQLHAPFHIVPVAGIAVPGAFIIFGNLISGLRVHVNDMLGNLQVPDRVVSSLLLLPVN